MSGIIETMVQRIENLEQLVEDHARELEQLRAEVAWRGGKQTELKPLFTYEEIKEFAETMNKKANDVIKEGVSSQQQRCYEIIDRAKRDVVELEMEIDHYLDTKYVVNRKKRTIVCLLERDNYGYERYIAARGIAKCHPDDCFNVHIGKAIALRRALNLKVPDEYLNAPQPTEVTAD